MKKVILSIGILVLTSASVFSQDQQTQFVKKNSAKDNWFIQAQGGGTLTISEYFSKASIINDVVTPHVALSVGKYFSPAVGVRLQGGGWESKNYLDYNDTNYKRKYVQVNADALVNLTNLFCSYNPERTFNLIGIAGFGYVHGFSKSNAFVDEAKKTQDLASINSIIPRVGVQFDFRASDRISLNLEIAGNLMGDEFNGITRGTKYDGTIDALAGVTFHLGKSTFDVADVIDPQQLTDLNNVINQQRAQLTNKDAQISSLKDALAAKPTVVVEKSEPETITETELIEETVMNAVVVFKLGKSELQDNQEINIYNAAKFFKENPNTNVIVIGYADNTTGTAAINQRLSEQRAKAVADILINKFGISASRVTTKASGDTVQPFAEPAWNRVVIFTAVKKK